MSDSKSCRASEIFSDPGAIVPRSSADSVAVSEKRVLKSLYPNKQKLPVIEYPDECWHCGLCQSVCSTQAIEFIFPEQMVRTTTVVTALLGKMES